MTTASDRGRTDSASRLIKASPQAIYQALIEPEAIATWRPPRGMHAEIDAFDAREGGTYRMALIYDETNRQTPQGKTAEHVDVVEGRFHELRPHERVVEIVKFRSDDPAFAGEMTITTSLTPAPGGTLVTIACENVPGGIGASDHQVGLASTLENLAAFTERP
jgi:uncharacterized protein YndB with AHSA1/START domain